MVLAILHSLVLQTSTASASSAEKCCSLVQQHDLLCTQSHLSERLCSCSTCRCALLLVYSGRKDPGLCSSGQPKVTFEKVQK